MKIAEYKTEGHFQAYLPNSKLLPFIKEYYILDLSKNAPDNKRELLQPTLNPEVIFKFGEDYENFSLKNKKTNQVNTSVICGIQGSAIACKRLDTNKRLLLVGVVFQNVGMYNILKIPMIEILNKRISINDIPKNIFEEIGSRIQDENNATNIISILDTQFLDYFKRCAISNDSFEFTEKLNASNANSINDLLKNDTRNYKYFERKFKTYIGITPAKYFKLKRYLNFYQNWFQHDQFKYIDLVYEHNYFDQNHLIKDFKSILYQSPTKHRKTRDRFFTENMMQSKFPNPKSL